MADDPIRLFGGLRSKSQRGLARGSNRDALFVEFDAPDLEVRLDSDELAKRVITEIQQTVRDNPLKRGLDPSGKPLPRISDATETRRDYRAEQYTRGGSPHPRYTKRAFKKHPNARKQFRKRFWNPRVEGAGGGGLHQPSGAGVPHGLFSVESGLLWRSAVVARIKPGVWGLFFANTRALFDEKGSSALGRVAKRVRFWSQQAMSQPNIQRALRGYVKDAIRRTRVRDLLELGRALQQTVQRTQTLARELEDFGSGGPGPG